jgi:autotransporter-associated beta strand protein
MGVLTLDPTNQDSRNVTIIKNGAGTLEISASNNFPIMEVTAGTLRVNHPLALGTDRSISTNVSTGTGSPNQLIVASGIVDLNGFSPAIGSLNDGGTGTGLILNNGVSTSTLTLGWSLSTVLNGSYGSVIANGGSPVALSKIGTNTQMLTGVNTYSGTTTVNNGALLVNAPGQIGGGTMGGAVTVLGGTFGGSGLINAPVIVQTGGILAPGAGASSTVTLTLTTNLTLLGTTLMNVDEDISTNDSVVLNAGKINYGGTLVISTNLMQSTTLAVGNSFKLFSAPAYSGNFAYILGSPGPGLVWSFNPSSGIVSVNNLASNPTNIAINFSASAATITVSWPTDHLGWLLQSQTNSFGLGSNWVDVAGSGSVNSINFPINPANPSVFYRLSQP